MGKTMTKMEQLQALKNNEGIQYLLNEAYKILGNPILVHDMDYKIIALTENIVTDDPIWNEFAATGTISSDWLEFYKNENFLDAVANAKKIAFLMSDKLKYERILGKLFNRDNIQIGIVSMEAHKPFLDDIAKLFECFCDILNKEIATIEYYRNYGQEYQETLINKLIEGRIEDRESYSAHVESIYMNLKYFLYLALADITLYDPTYTKLPYFLDLFKCTQPAFKYSIYSNYIVIIISSDDEMLNVKKDLIKLNKLFEQNNIYVGISSCFENLFELNKYYVEAVNALNYGLKSNSAQRAFQYCEMNQNSSQSI